MNLKYKNKLLGYWMALMATGIASRSTAQNDDHPLQVALTTSHARLGMTAVQTQKPFMLGAQVQTPFRLGVVAFYLGSRVDVPVYGAGQVGKERFSDEKIDTVLNDAGELKAKMGLFGNMCMPIASNTGKNDDAVLGLQRLNLIMEVGENFMMTRCEGTKKFTPVTVLSMGLQYTNNIFSITGGFECQCNRAIIDGHWLSINNRISQDRGDWVTGAKIGINFFLDGFSNR